MTKRELRKIYLEERKNLSSLERKEKSNFIAESFFAEFDLSKIHFLHCFLPIEKFDEIDTQLIFERVWRDFPGIETLVPRVGFQTNEVESLKFTSETKLSRNSWHIDEPSTGEIFGSTKIDIILIPLLAFDERGFRAGYGKGFYDRFLSKCRADVLKIGLSYFAPVTEISDVNEFDVKLDFCITPEKIWNFF